MDSSILELVLLPTGEVALKRVDSDEKPLMRIRFSEESELALDNIKLEVARAMVEAGIDAFTEMSATRDEDDEIPDLLH